MIKYIIIFLLFIRSLMGVEMDMGFGLFNSKAEGKLVYQTDFFTGSSAQINNDSQYHIYVWSDFDLELPYAPHIRLEYTRVRSSGTSFVHIETQNELINEFLQRVGGNDFELNSILTHNMYDAFLYYEFFEDSGWPALSFGGGIKDFDYDYDVDIFEGVQFNDQGGAMVPMLYTKIRKDLDDSLMGLEMDVKYYAFGDSDMYDIRAKIDMMFELNKQIDAGLEAGYRSSYFNIKGDDVENVGGNMKYGGIFFGFAASFR